MAGYRINLSRDPQRAKAEIRQVMASLRRQNTLLVRNVHGNVGRTLLRAGLLVAARAKEIITEKGHVVTGNLRRSIGAQPVETSANRIAVEVGTFVEYGPFIEALPDGGFLFPASEETAGQVFELLAREAVVPALEKWAAA